MERVAITGYGWRAAVPSPDEAWSMQARGESLVRLEQLNYGGGSIECVGAPTPSDPPCPYLSQRKWLKYMGPQTQLAVWAAGHALADAGLLGDDAAARREAMALILATGPIAFDLDDLLAGLLASRGPSGDLDSNALGAEGLRACSPMMPFHTLLNMPIGLVSMTFGIKGHNAIYYPDAEQSHFALSMAKRAIEHGRIQRALVGGTAQLMSLMPIMTYRQRGWLASSVETARPFTRHHTGWALGNAAAMVVLESESQARARGARVYGILDAVSDTVDATELHLLASKQCQRADLVIVAGTRNQEQDEDVRRIAEGRPCLSLDGVVGYAGPASLTMALAAGCRLLEAPQLYGDGQCQRSRRIDVVGAFSQNQQALWGKVRLEALS